MAIDAETNRAIGEIYVRIDKDRSETQGAIQQGFKTISEKLDDHKDETVAALKENTDQVHRLDLAVQGATSAQVLCRAQMEPRISTLEKSAKEKADKAWSIARPLLVKALEWAIMGGGLYAIYQALQTTAAKGGHP